MDPINVLQVFVKLEKDIAAFYQKLKNISSIRELIKTYEKMERQSSHHAERIMNDYKSFRIHDIDIAPLIILHNHVKRNLLDEIKNESNILFVLQKLADAEEQLGKIYKSIAVHYKKNAEKYLRLSEAIERIGDEEFDHRDAILKDLKKEAEKMDMNLNPDDSRTTLSADGYKAFKTALQQLRVSMGDLNLRESEEAAIKTAINSVDQTMIDNQQKINQFVSKCRDILRLQKRNRNTESILNLFEDIQTGEAADLKIVE